MRRLLCWFKHDWQCVYRYHIKLDDMTFARTAISGWVCFRCGEQRQEQWDQ